MACCCYGQCASFNCEGPGLASYACTPLSGVPCKCGSCQSQTAIKTCCHTTGITSCGASTVRSTPKAQIVASDVWGTAKGVLSGSATVSDVWNTFSSDVKAYYGSQITTFLVIALVIVFVFIFIAVKASE